MNLKTFKRVINNKDMGIFLTVTMCIIGGLSMAGWCLFWYEQYNMRNKTVKENPKNSLTYEKL